MRRFMSARTVLTAILLFVLLVGLAVWYGSQPIAMDEDVATEIRQGKRARVDSISTNAQDADAPAKEESTTLSPANNSEAITEPELTDASEDLLEESPESVVAMSEPSVESYEPRCMGLTRSEMELATRELGEEVHAKLTRIVLLYNEVLETCESAEIANPEVQVRVKAAEQEYRRLWQELTYPSSEDIRNNRLASLSRYASYAVALGDRNPTRPGGWIHDVTSSLPFRAEAHVFQVIWE